MKNKIIKIAIIVLIAISVGFNIYIGWKNLKISIVEKYYTSIENKLKLLNDDDKNNDVQLSELESKLLQRGMNIAINQILNQVQQTGQVKIGETILVPQFQVKINQ